MARSEEWSARVVVPRVGIQQGAGERTSAVIKAAVDSTSNATAEEAGGSAGQQQPLAIAAASVLIKSTHAANELSISSRRLKALQTLEELELQSRFLSGAAN